MEMVRISSEVYWVYVRIWYMWLPQQKKHVELVIRNDHISLLSISGFRLRLFPSCFHDQLRIRAVGVLI